MDPIFERALGYPYAPPDWSFVFDADSGEARAVDPAAIDVRGRHAVLAIGSNGSPVQLRRKFIGPEAPGGLLPVLRVELGAHDVVYAAAIAHYGSVPATLIACAGCTAFVHVTLLDDAQLAHLNRTEGVPLAYDLVDVAAPDVRSLVALPEPIRAYASCRGPLILEGSAVALAEIPAEGRTLPTMSQRQVLSMIAEGEAMTVEQLVALTTGDAERRAELAGRLPR